MAFNTPRLIISALKGGSGKTILSLGLIAAWMESGHRVAPFKKGPDFIDAGWLEFAASRPCYNLDPYLMDREQIHESFFTHSNESDVSLIEGTRGLFDGMDVDGLYSTAELSKLLKTPVIIIIDVTMATRTVAAVVRGCESFDPGVDVAGVILNRVAGSRQETLIRGAIEKYSDTVVVGAVPKQKESVFPERHMGLVPHQEREQAEKAIQWSRKIAKESLDLDKIWKTAHHVEPFEIRIRDGNPPSTAVVTNEAPRIGFIRDRAFWFYYPENLEQLRDEGAVLVEINAIKEKKFPQLDALYIGGGFPETQARALSDNTPFREGLKREIENGLPVYAECGGLLYLGESLLVENRIYPMVGALPFQFILKKRPQGHGYTIMEVKGSNPYYPAGKILKGHEFHYSQAVMTGSEDIEFAFEVKRGYGIDGARDGICKKNLLATYTHIHAAGNPVWAHSLFKAASSFKKRKGL